MIPARRSATPHSDRRQSHRVRAGRSRTPRARRGASTVAALLLGILVVGGAGGLWARSRAPRVGILLGPTDTAAVFGPRQFETPTGQSAYYVERFTVNVGEARRLLLAVDNGAPDGTRRATGVSVRVNGQLVMTQKEFDAAGRGREYIELAGEVTVEVTVSGTAGAYATARLLDVPDPTFLVFGPMTFPRAYGGPYIDSQRFTVTATAGAPAYLCIRRLVRAGVTTPEEVLRVARA